MKRQLVIKLTQINLLIRNPLPPETIGEYADFIIDNFSDITPEQIKEVILMYSSGRLSWDNFSGVQNIIRPCLFMKSLPCIEGFFEELPNGRGVHYQGADYTKSEWNQFVNGQWEIFRKSHNYSRNVTWTHLIERTKNEFLKFEKSLDREGAEFSFHGKLDTIKGLLEEAYKL